MVCGHCHAANSPLPFSAVTNWCNSFGVYGSGSIYSMLRPAAFRQHCFTFCLPVSLLIRQTVRAFMFSQLAAKVQVWWWRHRSWSLLFIRPRSVCDSSVSRLFKSEVTEVAIPNATRLVCLAEDPPCPRGPKQGQGEELGRTPTTQRVRSPVGPAAQAGPG